MKMHKWNNKERQYCLKSATFVWLLMKAFVKISKEKSGHILSEKFDVFVN